MPVSRKENIDEPKERRAQCLEVGDATPADSILTLPLRGRKEQFAGPCQASSWPEQEASPARNTPNHHLPGSMAVTLHDVPIFWG